MAVKLCKLILSLFETRALVFIDHGIRVLRKALNIIIDRIQLNINRLQFSQQSLLFRFYIFDFINLNLTFAQFTQGSNDDSQVLSAIVNLALAIFDLITQLVATILKGLKFLDESFFRLDLIRLVDDTARVVERTDLV